MQSLTKGINTVVTSPGRPPPAKSPNRNLRSARSRRANSSQFIASVNACRRCVARNHAPTIITTAIAQRGIGPIAAGGRSMLASIVLPRRGRRSSGVSDGPQQSWSDPRDRSPQAPLSRQAMRKVVNGLRKALFEVDDRIPAEQGLRS